MSDFDLFLQAALFGAFRSAPFVAALLLGLAIPLAILFGTRVVGRISPDVRLSLILGALIVGTTLSVALSGRTVLSNSDVDFTRMLASGQSPSVLGIRASQLFTLIALFLSVSEIFARFSSKSTLKSAVRLIWISGVLYFLLSVVVSGLFGTYRDPRPNDIYFMILLTAFACLAPECTGRFWSIVRIVLLVPAAGSLVLMAVVPQLVLQPGYKSLIPGFDQRLFGLADHANSLGPIAVVGLVLELCPFVRRRPSLAVLAIHLAVLVLTQSKTAWITALVVLPIVRWQWIVSSISSRDAWRSAATVIVGAVAVIFTIAVAIAVIAQNSSVQRIAEAANIYTLTGRFELWAMTLEEFYKSPIFGFGPSIWDVQYRVERGVLFAGQSHNQFVQILGQAGLLGALSMAAYIGVIGYFALKVRKIDHGLSVALLVIVLIRCLTESPLRMLAIMGWENFIHLLLLASVLSMAPFVSRVGATNAPLRTATFGFRAN